MRPYAERKAARVDRLRARAERLRADGEARIATADKRAEAIPFGQPILVGHHSERRDRNYREKIRNGFAAGFAKLDEAKTADRRADAAEANRAISSDDPEAVDALTAKLAGIERTRLWCKQINAAVRSKAPREALLAMGVTEAQATGLLTPDFAGRLGIPDYKVTNLAAEARRLTKRIADLTARAGAEPLAPETIGDVRLEESENRVRLYFPGKPVESVRSALKAAGFRWSPSEGAWQRQASNAAWNAARDVARTVAQ